MKAPLHLHSHSQQKQLLHYFFPTCKLRRSFHHLLLVVMVYAVMLSNCSTRHAVSAFSFTSSSSLVSFSTRLRSNHVAPFTKFFHSSLKRSFHSLQKPSTLSSSSSSPLYTKTSTSLHFKFLNKHFSDRPYHDPNEDKSPTGPVFPSFNGVAYSLPSFPSIITTPDLKKGQRIVTFGDVHGDIHALVNFLVTAQIMDPDSNPVHPVWSGGDTICVQTGDILDRGDDELACLRLLTDLARQAEDAGGALLMCFGNHEALNSVGLFHYANPGGNTEFERFLGQHIDDDWKNEKWRLQFAGNQPARWAAFEPGGLLASDLLAHMKVAVVLGRTVFVHAGLKKEHIEEYGSIENMNKEAIKWISQKQHDNNNNLGTYTSVEQVIEAAESRAKAHSSTMPTCLGGGIGSHSPVWMRDYSQPHDRPPSSPVAQQMIDETLDTISATLSDNPKCKVERMVMGHTPQMHINAALQGKAWRIDVGASKGVMDGHPEVLEIIHGGEDEADQITVLTMKGSEMFRIAEKDRRLLEVNPLDFM